VSTLTIDVGLNIALCDSFTLFKLRIKNIRRFKQAVSGCKMAGAEFHSIAKFRAQIINPVFTDCGVFSAECHNENGRTADCLSQESKFESGLPQVPQCLCGSYWA
jgi:hypothetical protein